MNTPIIRKSSLIEHATYVTDKDSYTPLQVLKSAAGYYIGTLYNNSDGYQEPGSRDSEYFPTFAAASDALAQDEFTQRDHP